MSVLSERPDLKIQTSLKNKGIQNIEVKDMTYLTLDMNDV
jgi:hypothetical protein